METYRNEVTAVRFAGGGSSYNQSTMSHHPRISNLEYGKMKASFYTPQ